MRVSLKFEYILYQQIFVQHVDIGKVCIFWMRWLTWRRLLRIGQCQAFDDGCNSSAASCFRNYRNGCKFPPGILSERAP
jgi:hypothetical protein